jgi:excisionase family DNA binding protein
MSGEQCLSAADTSARKRTVDGSHMGTAQPIPERLSYLSIEEAAAYLNVSVRFMRRMVCDRRMRHYKVGKFVRFRLADLDAFVQVKDPTTGPDVALETEVWRRPGGFD